MKSFFGLLVLGLICGELTLFLAYYFNFTQPSEISILSGQKFIAASLVGGLICIYIAKYFKK